MEHVEEGSSVMGRTMKHTEEDASVTEHTTEKEYK